MPNRHQLRIGDWISVARRLEELIAAGTGEDPFEVSLLMSAASTGALPEALSALVTHRRLALERELPAQIMRIHAAAMALSGLSLVVVAGAFFYTYYGSLAG